MNQANASGYPWHHFLPRPRSGWISFIAVLTWATNLGAVEPVSVRAGRDETAIRLANEAAHQVTKGEDFEGAKRKLDAALKRDPTLWPAFYTRAQLAVKQR